MALRALDRGRVGLAEPFIERLLRRLAEEPGGHALDRIVQELKGAARADTPAWPYETQIVRAITLPRYQGIRAVDARWVPGGALAVLTVDLPSVPSPGPPRWRLAWIDALSLEIDHIRTLVREGVDEPRRVCLAPGWEEEAALGVVYGSVLVRFDSAGRTRVMDIPLLQEPDQQEQLTAAALHPATGDLLLAFQIEDTTHLVGVEPGGRACTISRFVGQINVLAVSDDLVVGVGLRDIVVLDLRTGSTSLRDLYPYFADQSAAAPGSAVIAGPNSILIHEGWKVLRVSRDLRLIEEEFVLPEAEDRLAGDARRLVRLSFGPRPGTVQARVERRISPP